MNAYAEPVVSLDLDLVVVSDRIGDLADAARAAGMKVEEFEHSVILWITASDLRVRLQKDPRYQAFLPRAVVRPVLGYKLSVACLEDVLQGKVWAYSDRPTADASQRRPISTALEDDRRSCGRADRTPAAFLLTGRSARG